MKNLFLFVLVFFVMFSISCGNTAIGTDEDVTDDTESKSENTDENVTDDTGNDSENTDENAVKLVFRNENSSPEGYQIFTVEEKQNNPLAGEPDFVYLIMEKEGVMVEGPTIDLSSVDDPDEIFKIDENGRVEYINLYEEYGYADGLRAVFNDRLRFDIPIDDYEFEIALESLSSITLTKNEDSLSTSFVFLATGDGGVAHAVTISALIDENIVSTADPVTIEVRAEEDSEDDDSEEEVETP